jgi:hypothetical protein
MGGVGKVVRGKHWQFPVIISGAMTPEAVWAIVKPAFLANGWTAVNEWSAGGIELYLHYQKDGVEAWAETDPSPERASVEIVEFAPMPFKFTLTAPATAGLLLRSPVTLRAREIQYSPTGSPAYFLRA